MKHTVNLTWLDNMAFETELDGHKLTIDAAPGAGGNDEGPRPKKLLLLALAGCTGMDVVSILRKMRVGVEAFSVDVEADMTDEHPMKYERMKVIYKFKGKNLPLDKLEKAVKLSEEKYCGVSASYKGAIALSSEIMIEE